MDEYGNPIYGDVFATAGLANGDEDEFDAEAGQLLFLGQRVSHWGEVQEEYEESEESEEEESEKEEESEEEKEEEEIPQGVQDGTLSALPSGMETPMEVPQLRKEGPKQLYRVLEEQKAAAPQAAAALLGTEHTYVVPPVDSVGDESAARKRLEALKKEMPSDVDVSIDPADLEALDDESLKDLYQTKVREARAAVGRGEDFSDLVAAKAASQKRKAVERTSGKEKKFKF